MNRRLTANARRKRGSGERARGVLAAAGLALALLGGCMTVDGGGYSTGAGRVSPPPAPAPPPSSPELGRIPPAPPPVPARAVIRVVPSVLSFGPVEAGHAADLELTVANEGDAHAEVLAVSVEGEGFSLVSDGCGERRLPPRRACTARVRFAPAFGGPANGTLAVLYADPARRRLELSLRGEGVRRRGRRDPDIRVRDRRLDFGAVTAGGERTLDVEVSNAGNEDLRVREITADGRGFAVASDGCSGRRIEPGRDCRVAVRFTPPASGRAEGRLRIESDDPDERVVSIGLLGAGTEMERPRCPVVRLAPLPERGERGDEAVVAGTLPRGECITYALRIQRAGRVTACVPQGYALEARGFEPVKGGECRFPDDPVRYRKYRRRDIEAGTDLRDLTLTRRDDAPRSFRVIFRFRERGDREAEGDDD